MTDHNGVWEAQFNVYLQIGDVVSGNVSNFVSEQPSGNDDCCSCPTMVDTKSQRSALEDWLQYYYDDSVQNCTDYGYADDSLDDCPTLENHAVWVVLSRCLYGGFARFRKGCERHNRRTAIVNYYWGSTWKLFAHEVGHLFGAEHTFQDGEGTTGGIMDYGDFTYLGVTQYHPYNWEEICYGFEESKTISEDWLPNCWSTMDYDDITYRWRQTGVYSECWPCGYYVYTML